MRCGSLMAVLALLATSDAFAKQKAEATPAAVDPDVAAEQAEAEAAAVAESASKERQLQLGAFKDTVERFVDRMEEFNDEARQIIARREAEERQALSDGYRGPLEALRAEEVALRDTAIGRLEDFLVRYPASGHTPHAMFLLGDLYYEESEEAFSEASDAFEAAFSEDMDFSQAPEAPQRDHGRAVRLFQGIVDKYPAYTNADGALYMLGFIQKRDETMQANDDAGRDAYLALVDGYSDSEFAAAAHMALGEHFFDNHRIGLAIDHYSKVVELHAPDGQHYEKGLYKLAWSHYKLSSYDTCLDLLAKLLDWSEENFQRSGKRSAMAPEAIEYMAISFSDVSDNTGASPLSVARAFYSRTGERAHEGKIYERLADVLMQQARYTDAIAVYEELITRWPNEPKNPTFLWTVAKLYRSLDVPDVEAAQNTITRLNDVFNRDSAWANANRNNPDALAVADGYIEESLAQVAIDLHEAAGKTGDLSKYARASELYSQYLNKFPFAQDYYEIQWYLADTLRKSSRLKEAEAEYIQLLKGKDHPYRDGALWDLWQVRRMLVKNIYGAVGTRPPTAVVEERVDLSNGSDRSVYTLSDEHQALIASSDMLVDAEFQDEALAEALDKFRSAMAYIPGQILYHHGHLEEARVRLHTVIERWPNEDNAAYAASLIVDSWQDEGDLAKVRMWAGKFSRMRLGASEEAMAKNLNFGNLEEGAAFKMAAQYIEDGERLLAAEAFLAFMGDFPRSKHIKKAHYNAANNFEILGQVERANGLFRDYIDRTEQGIYPADDQAWPIYERIAYNYASALDLTEAVRYFELLYQRSAEAEKPYENAPAALYNAGFLRIGLGDHRGAAANLERYAEENREQLDAEAAMWSAADQWKLVSDSESTRFYERYLRNWGGVSPDHAIAAHYELALLAEALGDPRADEKWADVLATYNEYTASGKLGPLGVHYAAAAAFRPVQASFTAFTQYAFTDNDDGNAALINEIKKPALYALEQQCNGLIKAYPDFDYSSAALYTLGAAYLTFAKMLFEVPEPSGLDDEMLDMYFEALDELRIPVEDKGKVRLQMVLAKASKEKRWGEWTTKTLNFLASSFPSEFSRESAEIRGRADLTLVPMAGPIAPVLEQSEQSEQSDPADSQPAGEAQDQAPGSQEGVW